MPAQSTVAPTRPRIFHGWKVVGAGALIQSLQSAFYVQGYGQYAVVLERDFGWSKKLLSAGYSLNRAESGLLGPLQGWMLGRYGVRAVMRVGVIMMSVGLMAFSQINSVVPFFASLLVIAIGASLSGFLSIGTATVRWFERRRARASALSGMGFGLGGAMIPALVFSFSQFGWRVTSFLSGVIYFVVGWSLISIFHGTPQERGEPVDGDWDPPAIDHATPRAEGLSTVHFTAKQAIRTRAFWMISLGHAFAILVVGSVIAHLSLYLTSDQGYTHQQASFVVGALPIMQLTGNVIGGVLGDRVNKRYLSAVAMLGHMTGLLLLAYARNDWMIWAFVPVHGLAWGVRGPLMQAIRADYFGSTAYGQIMGISSLIVMLGTVGGPLTAGILADATGDYSLGFTILACLAGAGLTFFVLATPPSAPTSEG